MTIIFGENSSGKSSLALHMIKKASKAFYFALDSDKSIINRLNNYKNIEVKLLKDPFFIDIEMNLIERGCLKNDVSHIVVDTINYIKQVEDIDRRTYEKTINGLISGLEYLESTYDVKVIAVFNVLRKVDATTAIIMNYKSSHKLISTSKIFNKKKLFSIIQK